MLRILHTADVHLGARHADLGEAAAAQRVRQAAAFRATVDLALLEKVDLLLVAGDLFDSNTQPARSVERVGAELKRLAEAAIRTVIIPGTHDVYDRSSVYRAYDLAALAGTAGTDMVTVLTPGRPEIVLPTLDAVVYGRVFDTKRAPRSPLAGFSAAAEERATWRIGLIHGALAIPGRTEGDEVVFTKEEVGSSGLDYLALGHWHSVLRGSVDQVVYAYSGAPEPVASGQDGAGKVLLVSLELRDGARHVSVEERTVGRTRFQSLDLDVAGVVSQPAFTEWLTTLADPDLILDVRLSGLLPDGLDLLPDEVEQQLAPRFLRLRVREAWLPVMPDGPMPPPDTIAGSLVRDLQARIEAAETEARADDAAELRETLRLGRHLLEGREVTL
ncbi:MAG: metallophosphoesterase family protein [Candidatus Limnocylindrales bacterium]